jgi:hypothetical protein
MMESEFDSTREERERMSLPSSGDKVWVGAVRWIPPSCSTSSVRCRRAITLSVVRLET